MTILDVLACPACGGPLVRREARLACGLEGIVFGLHPSGLLDLRPPGEEARQQAEKFSSAYRTARLEEGWRPLAAGEAEALPFVACPGYNRLYWPLRRESWRALVPCLERLGMGPLTVADAGAGFLWMSHRLACLGHRVLAFDVSPDPDFGLGASGLYASSAVEATGLRRHGPPAEWELRPGSFLPVLGELEHPPLAAAAYDAVVCNASLHYVNDLPGALGRLARALRPAGALIVLDSPVARRGAQRGSAWSEGITRGNRVFGAGELEAALRGAGLRPEWRPVRRGMLWASYRLRNRIRGRVSFDFPILLGWRDADGAAQKLADSPNGWKIGGLQIESGNLQSAMRGK